MIRFVVEKMRGLYAFLLKKHNVNFFSLGGIQKFLITLWKRNIRLTSETVH